MARAAWIVIIAVVVCTFIGVQVYDNQMVPTMKKIQVVCDDPKHQGNRVVLTDEKPTIAKRKDARHEIVEVQRTSACLQCQKRKEQEFQIARSRAETDDLIRHLDYHFAFELAFATEYVREKSLPPGGGITFHVDVKNKGSSVIEGLRFIVQPVSYLYLTPFREVSVFDRALHDVHVGYDKKDAALLKNLTTTGLAVCDYQGRSKLFPQGNPYYPENVGYCDTAFMLRGRLALSPKLQPGQDVQFQGYLIYKNKKIPLGTLTVHVMYPG